MKNKKPKYISNDSLNGIRQTINSREMLCAAFAYDYEKNNNLNSYKEFIRRWNEFSDDFKEKIANYFYSFNNYEMLKKLVDINNLGKVHQIIGEFIRNRYSNENLETKKLEKVK